MRDDRADLHPGRVPGAERADVAVEKLRDYLLNPDHPTGRAKARFFLDTLGFRRERPEELRAQLLSAIPRVPGRFSRRNAAGRENWVAALHVAGPRQSGEVFTVWEILEDGRASFVTARPLRERDRLLFEE